MGGVTNPNPLAISTPADPMSELPGGAPATPASLPAPTSEVPVRDATIPMLPGGSEIPATDPRIASYECSWRFRCDESVNASFEQRSFERVAESGRRFFAHGVVCRDV